MLKQFYNINICYIPPFRKSKFIKLKDKYNFSKKQYWRNAIIKEAIETSESNRPVLILCENIDEANNIYILLKANIYKDNIKNIFLKTLGCGDILITTKILERGIDIKLKKGVEENYGLHVILTYIPTNKRVEEQAFGRTARNGMNGSGIMIVYNSNPQERDKISEDEIKRINLFKEKINVFEMKNDIFNEFCSFYNDTKFRLNKQINDINKIEVILKDLEEKWGIFVFMNDLNNENKCINSYMSIKKKFSEFIEKSSKELIRSDKGLINPFNYISLGEYHSLLINNIA